MSTLSSITASSPLSARNGVRLYSSEDAMPPWKIASLTISKISVHLIISIGIILFSNLLIPISFKAVVLPIVAFTVVFTTAFLFTSKKVGTDARVQIRTEAPA